MKHFYILLILLLFLVPFQIHASTATMPTLYLHLAGRFPTERSTLTSEIEKEVTTPLQALKGKVLFSYLHQVQGDGSFVVNLALSPLGVANVAVFNQYVSDLEKKGFKGLLVHFSTITKIMEMPELQIGSYDNSSEDPFNKTFQLSRHFSLIGLKEWNDFSNEYGFALLGRSAVFLAYIEKFVGDPIQFENLKKVMAKNNMIAIQPRPVLFLESGEVVGPQAEVSPFLSYRFFRNCYAKDRENGACYSF